MPTIAALGPENTFSDRAARSYAEGTDQKTDIRLYPTIKKTFMAVGTECRLGVLPMENMVEGYVQPVLDLLLHSETKIRDEFLVPIQFSFVANCDELRRVKRVYAQFVSRGQCSEFLDSISGVELVTTASNGASLRHVVESTQPDEGAIVPRHCLDRYEFALVREDVNDYPNNTTRFIVLGTTDAPFDKHRAYKTSLVIVEGMDRPGMLSDILQAFAGHNINLVSIMSRPTKELIGKYHFFVDFEGHTAMPHVREALREIRKFNDVKLLGSYPVAGGRWAVDGGR
jgi:prephenate dehydratase